MTTMIKNIIEKIIMTTFGKFVRGIEKDKLSVDLFGGNFKLENISLNHDFFDTLDLPFTLTYSSIGKLNLQAPLSKLSSVPVQCVLDSIYAIVQFKESQNEGQQTLRGRKQRMLKEVGDVLETALKKLKEQKKEDGMMAKLGKKIIDNLQLRIINVHLRFEQAGKGSSYAWGLTLEQISFTTTDNGWKPCFVERTADGKDQLYKMMHVNKLNFYWEAQVNQQSLLKAKAVTDAQRKERLAAMIKEDREVVLSITSEFKLIINPIDDFSSPLYELEVNLEPIKFELQRQQFMQMVDFARKNVMQNEMIVRSMGKKSKIKLSEEEKLRYKEQYQQFIEAALSCFENNKGTEQLSEWDSRLREILEKIEDGELKVWALGPIKRRVKAVREIEIKKKKSGWFSRGESELSQAEQEELQKFIDSSFQSNSVREAKYLLFRINTQLKGGRMVLVEHKGSDLEETIEFNIGKISSSISKSEDSSFFESYLEIAGINLNLFTPIHRDNSLRKRKLEIFTSEKPTEYREEEQEDSMQSFDSAQEEEEERPSFLKMVYKNELLDKTILRRTVTGHVERVTIIYKKIYMEKFRKFFSFGKGQFKPAHIDKLENINDDVAQEDDSFKLEKVFDVKLQINSPFIICPLNDRECWCLNLGLLSIKSNYNEQFEEFPMAIQSAFLRYYPHMKECFDLKRSRLKKGVFSLINDMDFTVNYQRFKSKREEVLSIELPSFKVNFTQRQYENLMSLSKVFKVEEDEKRSMVEQLKEQRRAVQEGSCWEGAILKKHETLMSWKEYHGILSGEHLYLYNNRQELRENCKIYIKNAKVVIKETAEEDNPELELINQNEICYLGCLLRADLQKWKDEIDKKCREFKTIHELIRDYENQDKANEGGRKASQIISQEAGLNKRKILRFTVSEVEFRYENEQEECLLQFQIHDVKFSRESMLESSEKLFSLKLLKITDRVFKFKNAAYQTLLQARDVKLQELKGRQKSEGARKSVVNVQLQDIYINWKPDVLLILLRIIDQHFTGEKPHRLDDDIEQSRDEHFKRVCEDSKFIFLSENYRQKGAGVRVKDRRQQLSLRSKWMKERMTTTFSVNKVEINLIHRESHLVIAKLLANQITSEFTVCETAKFVNGTVHTLELFDMTGYPRENYCPQDDYPPHRILSRKQDNSENCLIEFRWASYDHNSFPNEERIDSFMWVTIAPIQYEYYQQVTFRLVDYILIQVTLLINQPQMLVANQNLMEQLKREQPVDEKPVKVLFSQYEEVILKLVEPFFMDMYFRLSGPTLVLKAEKTSHIYYKTTINDLVFSNRTLKRSQRFQEQNCLQVQDLAYQEEYVVQGKDCHFVEVVERNGSSQQLFLPFEISATVNKLLFEDEINLLFPEVSGYDRSFLTINHISDIVIAHYSRLQYLNVNKLVNFNFTFDDQHDELFIHNFKITKLSSPKPIVYDVLVPHIHMTADYNARQNNQEVWKLFKASINRFSMTYRRTKALDSSFTLVLGPTDFTGFEYEQGKKEPIEHYLLSLGGEGQGGTDVLIQNKTTGEKMIQMSVNTMEVKVRTGLLQLIFQYTLIQDWVFPTLSKLVPEMTFYATVNHMQAQLCEDPRLIAAQLSKKKGSLKVIGDILSGKVDLATFRLEGLLIYKFHRRKGLSTLEYQQKLLRKEMGYGDFEQMDDCSSMNVILNTEIYRAWAHGAAKRKVIDKFTLTLEDKRYLRVADQKQCIIRTVAKRSFNIDRWLLKLSFKDIILLQNILKQIAIERQYISFLNNKTGRAQMADLAVVRQTESSSLQSMELKLQSVCFYLINSRRDIFIPILKLSLNGVTLSHAITFKKSILKGDISLAVYYFNNLIFRWEPVLERTDLAFHRLTYYQQNNRVFGSLESADAIMINISRQIFLSIKETAAAWKKQAQEEQHKYTGEQQGEPLQFVSHYIVRNETGYPIDILNEKGQVIKRVAHDEQMDYQQEIENYDEENQNQFFIGFKIVHPRLNLSAVRNISFNSEKAYEIEPRVINGNKLPPHCKIVIKPQVNNSKKVLMIKSSKYVHTYFDGFCESKALPFDHDQHYVLPKEHNNLKVSLYEQRVTDNYRYLGKDGMLKIMKKYLVYNYCPIPLFICGKLVQPNEYIGISEKLRIQDSDYKDSLLKVIRNEKQKEYYIFAECYIVDYYGLTFEFTNDNTNILKRYSHKFNNPDFTYSVYILPESECKFKVRMAGSPPVQLKTTIGKSSFVLEHKKALCPFSVYSYLSPLQNAHLNEFKRVVEITPQYMLSNATKCMIKICQAESCESLTLQPYQRVPFFWENRAKPKLIRLSSYDGVDLWGYSGNLTISKSTETVVLRKSSDPTMYRIFTLQIEITNTVTFIHILEPTPTYYISNKIPGTVLQVYQQSIMDETIDHECSFPAQFIFNVKYGEQKAFGYEMPLESHAIIIRVELDQSMPEFQGLTCDEETMDDVESSLYSRTINIRNASRKLVSTFNAILCFENNLKKLKLQVSQDRQQLEDSYEYVIKIPQIGVSFIGLHEQVRKEILHLMFNIIELQISGNADYSDFNLMVNSCRIENELKYNAIFPVIFESLHSKGAKYFLNFLITRSAKNSRLIHYIGCSINRSCLTLTSEELQVLQENAGRMKEEGEEGQVRRCEMFNSELPDPEESLYFVEAVVHPLRSNVTFKHVNEWGGKLLKTFSSINECPISAEGQTFKHFSCQNLGLFCALLLKHYQDGLSKMILPMIGNLTFLGSPITLVQKIGSGFKDLVQLPAEGFQTSPLQGGKGLARGAKSLLTNTFTGAFNSVQSLTGSISNGITLLVDDDNQFARDRERIKNDRSEHVLDGLSNGAKSIFNGCKNGLTGLFSQPARGAQKNGLPGFLMGAFKGVGGLVIKPLSGVIDAVSKTSEGIKNTPQYFSHDKQKRLILLHNPRPFYNYYKQFRNYDHDLADLIKILNEENSEKFTNLSWCGHYFLHPEKNNSTPILILSYEYLFIYDISRRKLIQTLKCQQFLGVTLHDSSLKIKLFDKKTNRVGELTCKPDGGCRKLASEINVIIRHFEPSFKFE